MLPLLPLLVGCQTEGAPGLTYFYQLYRYFPLDGPRSWRYEAEGLDHALVASSDGSPEGTGSPDVHELVFEVDCLPGAVACAPGELFRTRWSSDQHHGVQVHGHTVGASVVTFDPPVVVSVGPAPPDDRVVTQVGGEVWTSIHEGASHCEAKDQGGLVQEHACAAILLQTSAADGYPLAGSYQAFPEVGISSFRLDGDQALWILVDAEPCEPSANVACPTASPEAP